MASYKLSVPHGFLISVKAIQLFVKSSELLPWIVNKCSEIGDNDPVLLDQVSKAIREKFRDEKKNIPSEIVDEILQSYREMNKGRVSVRSSATMEDSEEFSFAGQNDTILNIASEKELIFAVVECWSSLFTPRSIDYRVQNGIPLTDVSMGIVVQRMVMPAASGVLFTCNPMTGARDEFLLDSTYGLGEALVSGMVEPDHWKIGFEVKNLSSNELKNPVILERFIGKKKKRIECKININQDDDFEGSGGTNIVENDSDIEAIATLSDAQIFNLVDVVLKCRKFYDNIPLDIEWAYDKYGMLYLLQARPITTLFPLPSDDLWNEYCERDHPKLRICFNLAVVQGWFGPWHPLGIDFIRTLPSKADFLHLPHVTSAENVSGIRYTANRIFLDASAIMRSEVGRTIFPYSMKLMSPQVSAIVKGLLDDERICPKIDASSHSHSGWLAKRSKKYRFFKTLRPIFWRVPPYVISAYIRPRTARVNRFDGSLQERLDDQEKMIERINGFKNKTLRMGDVDGVEVDGKRIALQETINGIRDMNKLGNVFLKIFSCVIAGYSALNRIGRWAIKYGVGVSVTDENQDGPGGTFESLSETMTMFAGGLPHNPTSEMDIELWECSRKIKSDEESRELFMDERENEKSLEQKYLTGNMPTVAMEVISDFLDVYGGRGFQEVDFGRERWSEAPHRLMHLLATFVKLDDDSHVSPQYLFSEAQKRIQSLFSDLLSKLPFYKRPIARKLFNVGWELAGLRESPKFHVVTMSMKWRTVLLERGSELVELGVFTDKTDVFMLYLKELDELAVELINLGDLSPNAQRKSFWKELVLKRRNEFEREERRKNVPILLLSDGRCFHHGDVDVDGDGGGIGGGEGDGDAQKTLRGTGVSVGVKTAKVRIVHDPTANELQEGEIMVCVGTDPAWTALFMIAGGLISEIGGNLAHGSIVAREFGIPAVVGIGNATSVLSDGDLVRINGKNGTVTILDTDK